MSGHSKWSTIKHKKAKVDAKRGIAFAKYSKEIIVAAKLGGEDIGSNFRLRTAVEKAKSQGVPNENIKRAIERGSKGLQGENYFELTYEGYGPSGTAIFIEALTDNKNRTAGDLRSYFSKYNGNLGESGCVGWMFKKYGAIWFDKDVNFDILFEKAIEFGAIDVIDEDDLYKVLTNVEDFQSIVESFEKNQLKPKESSFTRICDNNIEINDLEEAKIILKLMEKIEDHDDVQNVYSNFDFSLEISQILESEM